MLEEIRESLNVIADALETIKEVIYVITHPSIIWNWLMDLSYWLAAIICVFCILYYATTGNNKPARIMWITIVTYILLKGVDMVI